MKKILLVVSVPVLYALIVRVAFGLDSSADLYSVMTVTFLFCLPTIVGALTIYFSSIEKVRKWPYRFFVPWIPIFIFFFLTLLFSMEGWACWLMILPLFLIASSIGGLIGGYFKLRKKENKVYLSLLALLPFYIAPLENAIGRIPGAYEAYTFIDIDASPSKIWENVVRVREITEAQDKGGLTKFLRFPRPVKAELNYNGVGASREAIFTNGLVFHETVTAYSDQRKMSFTIKAYPYEIPSTTMDKHIVIGGQYFDVLNGTYELEQLNANTCRLYLTSRFKLSTTFNFYASIWAKWIMKDIQNNILQVEKVRAEKG